MTYHPSVIPWLFERQLHKMVEHNKTIRRKFADILFEYVRSICGVDA